MSPTPPAVTIKIMALPFKGSMDVGDTITKHPHNIAQYEDYGGCATSLPCR